ncbi:peptidase S10 [bacterium]|nr:peptidase S10 [bacterium]
MTTMRMKSRVCLLAAIFAFAAVRAWSADDPKPKETPKAPEEKTVTTTHTLTINGQTINYHATAGTLLLRKDEKGTFEPQASVFYVAYTRDGVDTATRPVTFAFNGGPGSSSVWLHLGALGPRRVKLKDDGTALPPPARLIDNEYTLLDSTDLVFIDPVSTGYSRPVPAVESKEFHGVQEDIRSVGEFIRLWTTRNDRWQSPKFLLGESYGTTRAAGLAGHLQEKLGMYLNGIMLISSVLDFQTLSFLDGNDLPYIVYLPSYAATAWYHHRLSNEDQARPLAEIVAEADKFATGEYATALLKGESLGENERAAIARTVARFTGLTPDIVESYRLRLSQSEFAKELLRDKGLSIGRYDSRYTAPERERSGSNPEFDPSYSALLGPMTAGLNAYMRGELNFKSDLPYEILTNVHPWNWYANARYLNLTETMRRAMVFNPYLKVFVARGYYDMATPIAAAQYTFDHLELPEGQRGRTEMHDYEAGHMMYAHKPSLEKLSKDLHGFMAKTTEQK